MVLGKDGSSYSGIVDIPCPMLCSISQSFGVSRGNLV